MLEKLGIRRPVDWVSNAWGGQVGAIAAASTPKLIRSLVMLGSPVAALTRAERARTYLLLGLYGVSGPSPMVVNGTTEVLLSIWSPHAESRTESASRSACAHHRSWAERPETRLAAELGGRGG